MIDEQLFDLALKELCEQKARERREAIEAGAVVDFQARRLEIERLRERARCAPRVGPVEVSENEGK